MGAIFETVMLVCFGLSWPINVVKAYKTHRVGLCLTLGELLHIR